jgi:hypothetical protein
MSYAYSSLLLLVSLAVAVYTVVMLLLRGQPDLAAAAALTWFLAAPAVLALGKQQADAAAARVQQATEAAEAATADATMEITDLEPPTKVLSDFHGTWIKVSRCSSRTTQCITVVCCFLCLWQSLGSARSCTACVNSTLRCTPHPLLLSSQRCCSCCCLRRRPRVQDAAASESMDAAMRLIHLNAVMRQAVKLIRGVQLSIEEDRFKFAVFSAISWFKLNEFFPWSGEVCENRRRDLRRGEWGFRERGGRARRVCVLCGPGFAC